MRLLVITSMYPPHHLGGYELLCRDTLQRWVGAGDEILLLASNYDRPDAEEQTVDGGVEVRRQLEWYWRDGSFRRPPAGERYGIERRNHRRLVQALRDHQPDVVSVWHMGGMSLGLLNTVVKHRLPIVYVMGDGWLGYGPVVDPWTSAWRQRPRAGAVVSALTRIPTTVPPLARSGTFCFISEWLLRRSEAALGEPFAHAVVIPPGIEPTVFEAVDPPVPKPWRDRLLCVGRVEPRKGFQTAVSALAELPAARLEVDGPDEGGHVQLLRDLASRLGVADRVEFVGSQRACLAARYAAADVLLFTSVWDEPFGLVPLEAMACGTCVIATGTGGSAEYLRHEENCLLVPPDDPAALGRAVSRLATDADLRDRIRRGGVRTAAAYSVDRWAQQLAEVHREAA